MSLAGTIVFSSGISIDFDIWTLELSSGILSRLTEGANLNDHPRWSPDGQRIAYVSCGEDGITSIWVMDRDGTNKKRLTTKHHAMNPSWSPDGSAILFSANVQDSSNIDLCLIPAAGGEVTPLLSQPGIQSDGVFSPDGRKILFTSPAAVQNNIAVPDTEICEYDLTARTLGRLASHPARDYGARYSPDGSKIAFVSHRNARSAADYRAFLAEYERVLREGSNADGRRAIAAMKSFEGDGDIFVMSSDGSNLRQLTQDSYADDGVSWSPCGNYLVYSRAPRSAHQTERLHLLEVASGKSEPLHYDRSLLEEEIGSTSLLDTTWFQKLLPNLIERRFIDGSFWGEERHPDWTATE